VAATLEVEAFMSFGIRQTSNISCVEDCDNQPNSVCSIQTTKYDAMFEMVQSMLTRMDLMEATIARLEEQMSGN